MSKDKQLLHIVIPQHFLDEMKKWVEENNVGEHVRTHSISSFVRDAVELRLTQERQARRKPKRGRFVCAVCESDQPNANLAYYLKTLTGIRMDYCLTCKPDKSRS